VAIGAAAEELPSGGPTGTAAAPTDVSQISGTWNGVSFAYPELFAITLELQTDAKGGLTGQIEYSPAHTSRQLFSNSKGSYKVTGKYDAASRTFSLKPGAWVVRDTSAVGNPRAKIGVLDARTGELAGLDVNNNPLVPVMTVLARDDAGSNLIKRAVKSGVANSKFRPPLSPEQQAARKAQQARAAKIAEQRAARGQPKSGAAANEPAETAPADEPTPYQPPTLDQIAAWASRIKQEKPDLDVGGSSGEQVYLLARNLFADDSFKPIFGTTYDQMTETQRYVMMMLLHKNGNEFRSNGNGVVTLLDRPFMYIGNYCAAEMTVEVLWQRPVRGWVEDMESSLGAMTGNASDFDHIAAMDSQLKTSVALLWPSESAKFTKLIAGTRTRLAVPALEDSADKLIASASGLDGVHALSGWMKQEKDLLQYVPADEKNSLEKRIEARRDQLVDGLIAQDVLAIPNFGHGLAAVLAGNDWYRQFRRNYPSNAPRFAQAIKTLQARRPADLAAAAVELRGKINKQQTLEDLETTLAACLGVPGDQSTPTGVQLMAAEQKQRDKAEHDLVVSLYSARERALMNPQGIIVAPKNVDPPSVEEVRLAVLRTLAMVSPNGKVLGPDSVRYTTTTAALFGVYAVVHVTKFELTAAPTPDPAGGYDVTYRGEMKMSNVQTIAALMDQSGEKTVRVQLGPHGWYSPSLAGEEIDYDIKNQKDFMHAVDRGLRRDPDDPFDR
jgi:hypothetical protein